MKVRTNGAKVEQFRTERGWTQQQLADEVRTSDRTIQRVESGEGAQRSTVSALAAVFGVHPDELRALDKETREVEENGHAWPVTLHRVTSGKKLLDLLLWANRLKFEHDLDPGRSLAFSITEFVRECGEISGGDLPRSPQWKTEFPVESIEQEIEHIGSLNEHLGNLADGGSFTTREPVFVYAGAYTRIFITRVPIEIKVLAEGEKPEYEEHSVIELVLLIHILGKEVPSVTVHVDREDRDELYSKEESDEVFGHPDTWKRKNLLKPAQTNASTDGNSDEDKNDDAGS
ncbi:MAG: helix-turn-helix transcriptional regulator [Candidatus Krumholzibacteria bacterium]